MRTDAHVIDREPLGVVKLAVGRLDRVAMNESRRAAAVHDHPARPRERRTESRRRLRTDLERCAVYSILVGFVAPGLSAARKTSLCNSVSGA